MTANEWKDIESDRCSRLGKWFGGCRFAARYSNRGCQTTLPDGLQRYLDRCATLDNNDMAALEAFAPNFYEGDVCIRCGKRSPPPVPSGEGMGVPVHDVASPADSDVARQDQGSSGSAA